VQPEAAPLLSRLAGPARKRGQGAPTPAPNPSPGHAPTSSNARNKPKPNQIARQDTAACTPCATRRALQPSPMHACGACMHATHRLQLGEGDERDGDVRHVEQPHDDPAPAWGAVQRSTPPYCVKNRSPGDALSHVQRMMRSVSLLHAMLMGLAYRSAGARCRRLAAVSNRRAVPFDSVLNEPVVPGRATALQLPPTPGRAAGAPAAAAGAEGGAFWAAPLLELALGVAF
jgi:hypothetical protein